MTLAGKKVGPYEFTGQIGAGGMAVVYKAIQPALERTVAIKELRGELAKDTELVTRFAREARYVAALAHQNIVHIYDFIERANAMYIVMEYVEGVDLYTLLGKVRRVPPDVAAIIALQTARALEYAHYRGVVHRDIKPSNLMVTRHGDVKLMDFGIARDSAYQDLSLTRPGIALGTPAYMSPEQILGERVDFRSDVFSLGIVLYQMVTGAKPFPEDDTRSVMNHILHRAYPRPRSLYPDIPWRLQRIIRRCLMKKPQQRYARTEQLRQDLEAYVADTVRVNSSGRLVMYLHHCHLISEEEAKTYIGGDEAAFAATADIDGGAVQKFAAVVRPALLAHAAALAFMLLWCAYAGWAELGMGLGMLHVNARPGAEVYVDGRFVNVTPLLKPIVLPAGLHRVETRSRAAPTTTRDVQLSHGETVRVTMDMRPR